MGIWMPLPLEGNVRSASGTERKPRSWIFEQAGLLMEEVSNERLSWPWIGHWCFSSWFGKFIWQSWDTSCSLTCISGAWCEEFCLEHVLFCSNPHYLFPALQARPLFRWLIPIVWDGSPNAWTSSSKLGSSSGSNAWLGCQQSASCKSLRDWALERWTWSLENMQLNPTWSSPVGVWMWRPQWKLRMNFKREMHERENLIHST